MNNITKANQEIQEANDAVRCISMNKTIYLDEINVPIRLETMERLLKNHYEEEEVVIHYNEYKDSPFSLRPIFLSGFIFERDDTHLLFGDMESCDYNYLLRLDKIKQIHLVTKGIYNIAGWVIRVFLSNGEHLDIEQNSGY